VGRRSLLAFLALVVVAHNDALVHELFGDFGATLEAVNPVLAEAHTHGAWWSHLRARTT
jgi:hypothetical protein